MLFFQADPVKLAARLNISFLQTCMLCHGYVWCSKPEVPVSKPEVRLVRIRSRKNLNHITMIIFMLVLFATAECEPRSKHKVSAVRV